MNLAGKIGMEIPSFRENYRKNYETQADLLTDFDGTMIKEESQYFELLALFLNNPHRAHFVREAIHESRIYKKTGDVHAFYLLFKGSPIIKLDRISKKLHQSEEWNRIIEKLNPEKTGIVSRNNKELISEYLNHLISPEFIGIEAANSPKSENGIYTGEAEVVVNNENLKDIIGKRPYLCKEDEKTILEKSGLYPKRLEHGFYILEGTRLF